MIRSLALAAILTLCAAPVAAQEPSGVERALALTVARVGANEAFGSLADVDLAWQVTEAHGSTNAQRLRWLRRHSRCASGADCNRDGELDKNDQRAADNRPGNAGWSRNLSWGLDLPWNWSWSARAWRTVGAPTWATIQQRAIQLVTGRLVSRPCVRDHRGGPTTWGGDMDVGRARRNGLESVVCRGTRNTGYRRASRQSASASAKSD